jgi:glycosyltransferase involved in cell wall biosynthesis
VIHQFHSLSTQDLKNKVNKMKKNKVSVIIPAYNAISYVMDAINSVRFQEYTPIEILLIDDGSIDGTADLVCSQAPEVQIIRQQNAGVAAARNTGLRAANGELICFLDADDGWFPGKIDAQVNYLRQHPSVGLVYHHWLVWQPKPNKTNCSPAPSYAHTNLPQIDPLKSGWIYPQLLLDCIVHTSTVMLRRKIIQQVGEFDESLINGEDYNYWLRVSQLCEIHKLSGVYSFYRAVPNSLSNRPKSTHYEYLVVERALKDWGLISPDGSELDRKKMTKRLSQLAMSFGYLHFHSKSGSTELAWRSFFRSIKHDPFNVKAFLYLIAARIKAGWS